MRCIAAIRATHCPRLNSIRRKALVATLAEALAPLERLKPGEQPFATITQAHREAVAALAGERDELADVFDEIAEHGALGVARADYAELFHAALANRPLRDAPGDARIQILGTLESRLHHVDRAVLGGLAEGIWPPDTRADPWLSPADAP